MSQQINLYNPALLKRREWLSAPNVAAGAAVLLVVMAAWTALARYQASRLEAQAAPVTLRLKAAQEEMAALTKALAERQSDPRIEAELKKTSELLQGRQKVLEVLSRGLGPGAVGFAEYLPGFARQTPRAIWLTAFTVAADGSAMEIRGRTTDPALLPDYIQRLSSEKAFKGRAFAALELSAGSAEPAAGTAAAVPGAAKPLKAGPLLFHEFALIPRQEASGTDTSPLPADTGKAVGGRRS